MFDNLIRKVTNTVKETVTKEIIHPTKVKMDLGFKVVGIGFIIAGAVIGARKNGEDVKEPEAQPGPCVSYSFYNADEEMIGRLFKF